MEEKKLVKDIKVDKLHLQIYQGVTLFKSIRRAIRRGHITELGMIAPKRPFNNRKRTSGRNQQLFKESIYGQIKHRLGN